LLQRRETVAYKWLTNSHHDQQEKEGFTLSNIQQNNHIRHRPWVIGVQLTVAWQTFVRRRLWPTYWLVLSI